MEAASGDRAAALADLDAALARNPANVQARYDRAVLEAGTQPRAAIADYRTVLVLDPSEAAADVNLSLLLAQAGDRAAGMAAVQAGLRLDPSFSAGLPAVLPGPAPRR